MPQSNYISTMRSQVQHGICCESAIAQQWHAAARTSSKLDITRAKRRPDSGGECDCGAPREDARHLYLECPRYSGQRPVFRNALSEFCNVLKKGHDPTHPVARHWDIDEEQALAWVHTNRPLMGGAGGLLEEPEKPAQALRAKAMAFYHGAITTRRLPRRRTAGCAAVTILRVEEPVPPPAQTCADRRHKRDAFGRVRDGKANSDDDLYWNRPRRGAAKRCRHSS